MWTRDERGAASLGGVPRAEILAPAGAGKSAESGPGQRFETPVYVYDLDAIAAEARALISAFGEAPHLVAYAIKANSAGPIVRALITAGCGIEVVDRKSTRLDSSH